MSNGQWVMARRFQFSSNFNFATYKIRVIL